MTNQPSYSNDKSSKMEIENPQNLNLYSSLSGVVETSSSLNNQVQDDSTTSLLNKKRKNSMNSNVKQSKNTEESPKNKNITHYFKQKKEVKDNLFNKPIEISKEIKCKDDKAMPSTDFLEEIINKTNKIYFNGQSTLSAKTVDILSKFNTRKPSINSSLILCEQTKTLIESVKKRKKEGNKSKKIIDEGYEILREPSMRDKYEGLLRRELLIPVKYKECFKKMVLLDEAIDNLKNHSRSRTFTLIQNYIKSTHKKDFKLEDLQRILFIGPHLYIYKWEKYQNDYELVLDIPSNIAQRLNNTYDANTNFQNLQTLHFISLEHSLTHEIKGKREEIFKECLINLTLQHHTTFLKDKKINTKLNPIKHKTWHHEFDVHNCPDINKFPLQQKPKRIAKIF